MFKKALKLGAAAVVALTGTAEVASAQPAAPAANSGGGGDIVITARKKAEKLQNIPISVTAATGNALQQARITQPTQLGRLVPTLTIQQSNFSSTVAAVTLRGQNPVNITLNISQPVGLYEDSVNIPHPYGTNSSYFDLDRIEVLKGPQGTLYGRNTSAGAMNIITRSPDYNGIHGFLNAEGTNFNGYTIGGAVNIPIIDDVLAVRLGAQHAKRDGFGHSLITGQTMGNDKDDNVYRASVRFDPTDNFSASFKAERVEMNHNGPMLNPIYATNATLNTTSGTDTAGSAAGREAWNYDPTGAYYSNVFKSCLAKASQDIFVNCTEQPWSDVVRSWHGALDLKWKVNDAFSVRSITGYHQFANTQREFDLDGAPDGAGSEVGIASNGLAWFAAGVTPPAPTGGPCVGMPTTAQTGYLPDCTVANTVPISLRPPFPIKPEQESTQWTQEFNFTGDLLDGGMNWLVGLFLSSDTGDGASYSAGTGPATSIRVGRKPVGQRRPGCHRRRSDKPKLLLLRAVPVFDVRGGCEHADLRAVHPERHPSDGCVLDHSRRPLHAGAVVDQEYWRPLQSKLQSHAGAAESAG